MVKDLDLLRLTLKGKIPLTQKLFASEGLFVLQNSYTFGGSVKEEIVAVTLRRYQTPVLPSLGEYMACRETGIQHGAELQLGINVDLA